MMSAHLGERDGLSRFLRDEVLPRLGIEDVYQNVRFRERGRQWRAPCPLHNGNDPNFVVSTETLEWKCHSQCQEGGDAAAFIMKVEGLDFRGAVLELARRAGVDTSPLTGEPRPTMPPRPKPIVRAVVVEKNEPTYPPAHEVAALWAACTRVDDVPEVRSWLLEQRCIDPTAVADRDLARAAPTRLGSLPSWAGFGGEDGKPWRSWPSVGLRLIVPLYDHHGRMRSVLFRRAFETGESWPPKSMGAKGFDRVGLAMACPFARQLLEERQWPAWWLEGALRKIVVAEGETDFLTYAAEESDAGEAVAAVIGGFSGSWSLLAHVPAQSVLVVQTHGDRAGARYASEILAAVMPRWRGGELAVRLPRYFKQSGERVELRA